jgi:H+/Cl- antiporter ClcA
MKYTDKLEKLLPFGYLYLVLIGLFKESVFHYMLGINILKYSTIMDILISPIATMTSHPLFLFGIIGFCFGMYGYAMLLKKYRHKAWIQKSLKLKADYTKEEVENVFRDHAINFIAFGLLSFFLGVGVGNGSIIAKKIKSGDIRYNNKLNYNSGESEDVYLINTNSVYYFYIAKGSKTVKIAPLGAIKSLELTENKKLQ